MLLVKARVNETLWRDGYFIPPDGIQLDEEQIEASILERWKQLPELEIIPLGRDDVTSSSKRKDKSKDDIALHAGESD